MMSDVKFKHPRKRKRKEKHIQKSVPVSENVVHDSEKFNLEVETLQDQETAENEIDKNELTIDEEVLVEAECEDIPDTLDMSQLKKSLLVLKEKCVEVSSDDVISQTSFKIENFHMENNTNLEFLSDNERTQSDQTEKGKNVIDNQIKNLPEETKCQSTFVDYKKLLNEIKSSMSQAVTPSAPLADDYSPKIKLIEEQKNDVFHKHLDFDIQKMLTKEKECKGIPIYEIWFEEELLTPFTIEELHQFYSNSEINQVQECINEFLVQEINYGEKKLHFFYELLSNYLQVKNNLKMMESKINDLTKKVDDNISKIWSVWKDIEISDVQKCNDGNPVDFIQKYTQVKFNDDIFEDFKNILFEIKSILFETLKMDFFNCLKYKLKIEDYIQSLLSSCGEFTNLQESSPISLVQASSNVFFQQCLLNLRLSVGILFSFQRKPKADMNQSFIQETRLWLKDLISVLIRTGSWKDHLFILNHILRCPGGAGEWAAWFIQFPTLSKNSDPFSDPVVNHIMTVLAVMLQPIQKREEFINQWNTIGECNENSWVLIDSDDEDEEALYLSSPLKENDMVSFLNQIPLKDLFSSVLGFKNGKLNVNVVTSEHLLKMFAFFNDFINIIHTGLQVYSCKRYRQFSKRLGRLVLHTIEYATNELNLFKMKNQALMDETMVRLQTEYDNFFLKSTKTIYSSGIYGTWQYLTVTPYEAASTTAILKLYAILQLNDENCKSKIQINLNDFEEKLQILPESEQFYLLSTFMNMALARKLTDLSFIKLIVHQLFYIGFLSDVTKDQCYKNVNSLLYNLCCAHPFLISEILCIQNKNFMDDKNCDQILSVFLWKELPIKFWKPSTDDLQIISIWLMQPLDSTLNEIARTILKSLNYDVDETDLFLPIEIHRSIAHIIMKANVKFAEENEINVIKNVSTLVRLQEPEQTLQTWSWNVLLKLRLHLFDQSISSIRNSILNLNENLRSIPDLFSVEELHALIKRKEPVACFIALMTTTLGHSVPVIFNEGFNLLEILIRAKKYNAALACIEHMLLMFLECPDSLYKSQVFASILAHLMSADFSYIKVVKTFKSYETPGPILLSLENMIQNQINLCDELGINHTSVIEIWVKLLTKHSFWIHDAGIVYLLDMLCKNAFFDGQSFNLVKDILTKFLLETLSSPTENKSTLASFVNWMNIKSVSPTLLDKGFHKNSVWFFLTAIEVEHEIFEHKSCLWRELLKELHSSCDKKTNIENSLKKVCTNLQISMRTYDALTIYRLIYQIIETSISHPAVILLWQKFFLLYLERVPGLIDRGSIGEKFFEGIDNQNCYKKLRQKLKETLDYYIVNHERCDDADSKREYYSKCAQVFHTFQLWFDEPKLHQSHLNLHLLPSQFNSDLLKSIIYHNAKPWIEFLDHLQIRNEIKKCSVSWQEQRNRRRKIVTSKSSSISEDKSSIEKIQDGVTRYENPLPAPVLNKQDYISLGLTKNILTHSGTLKFFLKPSFTTILNYATCYVHEVGEHIALSCELQDLIQQLYTVKKTSLNLSKACNGCVKLINGVKFHFKCSGPAVATLSFEESETNKENNRLFDKCLRSFYQNLQRSNTPIQQNLGVSVVTIEKAVDELISEYLFMRKYVRNEEKISDIKICGISLFYNLVKSWIEDVSLTPSICNLFKNCVDNLGRTFIVYDPEQCQSLLEIIKDHPKLVNVLHTYLNPCASSTQDFIELYSKVKDFNSEIRHILLSRFDVVEWLTDKTPRFAERSQLISLVTAGLKSFGTFSSDSQNDDDMIELFNSHLQLLLKHDFPEHYGEILNILLEASAAYSLPVSSWFMFLNSIAPEGICFIEGKQTKNVFEPGQNTKTLKLFFAQYATQQNMLSLSEIRETILHLANLFRTDRLRHGLNGLYPKYGPYAEAIFIFCGMLSHAYIAETLKFDMGSLSMSITNQLWPLLRDLYSPWLVPYWSKQEKSQAAKWIQELTDDKCVLLPWVKSESSLAFYCCTIFTDSIRFVLDTLPGVNNIMNHVWVFYVTNYANSKVKEHNLSVIHKNLLNLPWCNFFPTMQDVELMVEVVEHFIPLAHSFLGSIFVEIKWADVKKYHLSQNNLDTSIKFHVYLLHLLVKLPCEPSLKQNVEMLSLLSEARYYSWHLIDSNTYDSVLNWFVMSSDPRIVLMDEKSEYYQLDTLMLQILESSAGFSNISKQFHQSTFTKRLMFVRANVKWLITANNRFKCKDSAQFKSALTRMLNYIQNVIDITVTELQKVEEIATLFAEFFNIFKEEELNKVVEVTIITWLSENKCNELIFALLRSIGIGITNITIFGNIAEACLICYFDSNDCANWTEIASKFVMPPLNQNDLEKSLTDNNNFLALYVMLLSLYNENNDSLSKKKIIISDVFHILACAKRSECTEPKLVVLILFLFQMADIMMRHDESEGISILQRLSGYLVNIINDKGSGLLSTLGLRKSDAFTSRFRFVCLIACCGIMKLFNTSYSICQDKIDEKILHSLDQASGNKQYRCISKAYLSFASDEIKKVIAIREVIDILKNLGLKIYNKLYIK